MLVLFRKPGESIVLDGGIEFHIIEFVSGGVRVGIDAPRNVGILRSELKERPQIELGAPPAIKPEHLADIREVLDNDCDAEPLPRFMTPMQKLDWATRGINKRKNHHHED